MEQSGYDFEKGRIRAQQELNNSNNSSYSNNQSYNQKKKSNIGWWIAGWIFFFPIPLTILIWRSSWEKKKKIIATIILWVVLLIIAYASPSEDTTDVSVDQSNGSSQIEESEYINDEQTNKKIIFLENTNSDEFANILKDVTGITDINGVVMGDSITYSKSNEKYSISIDANKDTKEIDYIQIISLTNEDATNVFMSLTRLNYKNENDADYTSWLTNNLGKESKIKIGDANFELALSTSNNPYIIMKTDGSDDYMQEQIDKLG